MIANVYKRWGAIYFDGPNGSFCKHLEEVRVGWVYNDLEPIAASLSEQCGATVDPGRLAWLLDRRVEGRINSHAGMTSTPVQDRFRKLRLLIKAGDPTSLATALELCR